MDRHNEMDSIVFTILKIWRKSPDLSFTELINEILKSVDSKDGVKNLDDIEFIELLEKFDKNAKLLGLLRDFEQLVK